jgi:hypothetical protein
MSMKLTSNHVKHSLIQTNNLFVCQDIWSILRNPEVRYCVHKSSPSVHNVSYMNPGHTFTPYTFKLRCIVSLLTICNSSNWFLIWLPQVVFAFINVLLYAVCRTHLHWFRSYSLWYSVNLRSVKLPNLQFSPNSSSQNPNLFSSRSDKDCISLTYKSKWHIYKGRYYPLIQHGKIPPERIHIYNLCNMSMAFFFDIQTQWNKTCIEVAAKFSHIHHTLLHCLLLNPAFVLLKLVPKRHYNSFKRFLRGLCLILSLPVTVFATAL